MIRLENINKTFHGSGGTVEAVRDVSLHVEAGEIFGIIGLSGAGKSTLVRCINLLERPDRGRVVVDGTELTALPEKALRRQRLSLGMIFQHFNLMPSRTVYENIAYPLKKQKQTAGQIERRVTDLLELVDLRDKRDAYPNQLSGGQKQRVAIAGIIAMQPDCIVLDEPTAMLDPVGRREIMRTVHKLNRELGITVVLITHHMNEAADADRVIVMSDGRVLMDGTPREIFNRAEELIAAGLTVPQPVELLRLLKAAGIEVQSDALTPEECAAVIYDLMQKNKG